MTTGALTVLAPVPGTVVSPRDLHDPVFAEGMMGPGLGVDLAGPRPARSAGDRATGPPPGVLSIRSPVTGRVAAAHPHAFVVEVDHRAVLVHLGLDAGTLRGAGFTGHVGSGGTIAAGEPAVTWDTAPAVAAGIPLVCLVVALRGPVGPAPASDVTFLARPGETVSAGQPLLEWA